MSSGSGNSLFSIPSTAHFGRNSPSELAEIAAAIASPAAPAVSGGAQPAASEAAVSETFTIGSVAPEIDAELPAAQALASQNAKVQTTPTPSYAPTRQRARSVSVPRASGRIGMSHNQLGPVVTKSTDSATTTSGNLHLGVSLASQSTPGLGLLHPRAALQPGLV